MVRNRLSVVSVRVGVMGYECPAGCLGLYGGG